MAHYLGGDIVSYVGVDVGQLNFKMADHVALVREADHVIVSMTVFVSVATQSQTLMVPVLWGKMSHEHSFVVTRGEEGGDEEKHGASVTLQQVLTF